MSEKALTLEHEQASQEFAKKLAFCLNSSLVMGFSGDIGTGKTAIIRALLKELGVESAIKSPTFSIVESYLCNKGPIHHFDLYRIHHEEELEYIGFRDYFSKDSLCCIEWVEHAENTLPQIDIRFKLSIQGTGRLMQMIAFSKAGESVLSCLVGEG